MTEDANQGGSEAGRARLHYLAEWRQYRGYASQRDLARAMRVDHTKISRIEKDETELRPGFAQKLARFFHIPLAALYATNPLGEGREDAEMFDAWAEIPPEDRRTALRVLRSFGRRRDQREIS